MFLFSENYIKLFIDYYLMWIGSNYPVIEITRIKDNNSTLLKPWQVNFQIIFDLLSRKSNYCTLLVSMQSYSIIPAIGIHIRDISIFFIDESKLMEMLQYCVGLIKYMGVCHEIFFWAMLCELSNRRLTGSIFQSFRE